ncbi:MAG: hypothetical protein AAB305_06345 [Candidatus Zixiibacteriota bacterium]
MTQRTTLITVNYFFITVFLLSSCTSGRQRRGVAGEDKAPQDKIVADAYLFDAKIHRHGKPTSIRLELYAIADTVYIYGRAYLGKGALHARLTRDSLVALFPTEREYLSDRMREVISSNDCPDSIVEGIHLARLLTAPPDSHSSLSEIISHGRGSEDGQSHKGKKKTGRKVYATTNSACKWTLQLDYDTRAGRQTLVHILFDDGDGTRINASLRERKLHSRVPQSRVSLDVPADYFRLSPR